jgi:hypothetical protein
VTGAEASPILELSPAGVLTGAKYVDVYGIGLYEVTFKTGTCAQVFGDCSLGAPFVFSSLSTATTAGFALLDQVFVDGPFPNLFDSNPGLTSGCNSSLAKHVCGFTTPYGTEFDGRVNLLGSLTENGESGFVPPDRVLPLAGYQFMNDLSDDHYEWAVWSESVPVPEPGGLAMVGVGLLGLIACGLRKRRVGWT